MNNLGVNFNGSAIARAHAEARRRNDPRIALTEETIHRFSVMSPDELYGLSFPISAINLHEYVFSTKTAFGYLFLQGAHKGEIISTILLEASTENQPKSPRKIREAIGKGEITEEHGESLLLDSRNKKEEIRGIIELGIKDVFWALDNMKFYEAIKEELANKNIQTTFDLWDFYDIYDQIENIKTLSLDPILEQSPIPLSAVPGLVGKHLPRDRTLPLAHISMRDVIFLG